MVGRPKTAFGFVSVSRRYRVGASARGAFIVPKISSGGRADRARGADGPPLPSAIGATPC